MDPSLGWKLYYFKKMTFSASTPALNSCKGYISTSLERLASVYFESCWLNKHDSGGF